MKLKLKNSEWQVDVTSLESKEKKEDTILISLKLFT